MSDITWNVLGERGAWAYGSRIGSERLPSKGLTMKLTKRGEAVFTAVIGAFVFSVMVMCVGATVAGINFIATHERVTDTDSCKQTPDGLSCDIKWVRK